MADLSQALSEIKSMPDHVLAGELKNPTGMFPGWLALGEIHERKRLRATTGGGNPTARKSMAEEYSGSIQPTFAGAGMRPPPQPPQQPMPPQGIAGLPQQPRGYASGGIVSLAGGGLTYTNQKAIRNQELQAQLAQALQEEVAATYGPGYSVEVYSGGQPSSGSNRTGSHRHDEGGAGDFYIRDPQGNKLIGDQLAPFGQNWLARRGGNLGWTMKGGGVHADLRNLKEIGGGRTWDYLDEGGSLTDAQRAATTAGLRGELYGGGTGTGGGGGGGGGMAAYQRALLDTIAGPESGGKYNVMYGGQTFDDYSQHPGIGHTISTGPNAGQTSSAAGRYQFLVPTWNEQVQKYGYKDFSPETQDTAAWNYANDVYKAKTGNDLSAVLQSGDPTQIARVGNVLSGTWTSLPGGIEQGTNSSQFVSAYQTALSNPSTAVAQAAGDAGAKMAVAEAGASGDAAAAGGDPMQQLMMAQTLMGKGSQPAKAAPAAGPVRQAIAVNPEDFYMNKGFMRRGATYG